MELLRMTELAIKWQKWCFAVYLASFLFSIFSFVALGWVLNQRSQEFSILIQSGSSAMKQLDETQVLDTIGQAVVDWKSNKSKVLDSAVLMASDLISRLNAMNATSLVESATDAIEGFLKMAQDFTDNPTVQLHLNK
jgi:hypothetical protein